jgi:tryptophan 7-halogenase
MKEIRRVVIAGGGTAGWMAAAALSQQFHGLLDMVLIESEEIGTVGVGESTIPPIRGFHRVLGIGEQEFMRATAATFKLGILFENWGRIGERYIHPFGEAGKSTWSCPFHHFWLHGKSRGIDAELGEYCLEHQAAAAGKFITGPNAPINYAYHLDASVYAKFLRTYSEKFGVRRIEGKIREVRQNGESGFIESLVLESGQVIEGDLYIDCTGFRGLLIEQTLKTGYEDWNHWLPCDRAVAVQTESTGPAAPYTRAIAHEAGWRWRIPLQHRVGNGLVYCSEHMSDDEAHAKLLREIEGRPITQPRVIPFRTGRRRNAWNKNVIAVGLANGFVEPLESTSIHLIMASMTRLISLFPFPAVTQVVVDQYNEEAKLEAERVRDFIILHYCATQRDDSPLWKYCASMPLPEALAQKIEMFRTGARVWHRDSELFRTDSWLHVMLYQGIRPEHYHRLAAAMGDDDLVRFLENIRTTIRQAVDRMPTHQEFVDHYARASGDIWNKPAMGMPAR